MADVSERAQSLRHILETTIFENPDEIANFAAYADHLLEQDDPNDVAHGELIQVQLALEDDHLSSEARRRLQRQEQTILQAHQREWLGEMTPFFFDLNEGGPASLSSLYDQDFYGDFRFRRGRLGELRLWFLNASFARVIARSWQCRLLQDLEIEAITNVEYDVQSGDNVAEGEWPSGLCPLLSCPHFTHVRRLKIGKEQGDEYRRFTCEFRDGRIPKLVSIMPRLEELRLFANGYDLEELLTRPTLSHLRLLQLYHVPQVHHLERIAENPAFQHLEALLIHPPSLAWLQDEAEDDEGSEVYRPQDGYLPMSVVRALLHSENLPSLRSLRLRLSSMGDEGCQEIVSSGILKRLTSLDLRHGRITDVGARTLANCADVKNLEWLDLDRNVLSSDGIDLIRGLGVRCRVDDQQLPADLMQDFWPRYLLEGAVE